MYSSSCNVLFIRPHSRSIAFFFIYCHPRGKTECKEIDWQWKEEKKRPKESELHELLYTWIVKSETISLTCRSIVSVLIFDSLYQNMFNPAFSLFTGHLSSHKNCKVRIVKLGLYKEPGFWPRWARPVFIVAESLFPLFKKALCDIVLFQTK